MEWLKNETVPLWLYLGMLTILTVKNIILQLQLRKK